MAKILLIETSTALCSAALSIDGKTVASRRSDLDRKHASLTAVFCDEILRESGLRASDLDAVCISDGPGSYTGLRVGLSTAKGLCFGAGIKLLSVSSLDILAAAAVSAATLSTDGLKSCCSGRKSTGLSVNTLSTPGQMQGEGPKLVWEGLSPKGEGRCDTAAAARIVPMIDARRMEVYTATYDMLGHRQTPIEALVVEQGAFSDIAAESIFIGDGALKCKDVIGAGTFIEAYPEASAMAGLAEKEYAAGNFRDVAYFEPFYLKEFVATTSKKKLF